MIRAYLDLGSNLDREASIRCALRRLERRFLVNRTSSVYETAAVGPPGQPPYYNLSVELMTDESPEAVRASLKAIEQACGRGAHPDRYAPRTVDLDLILLGDTVARGEDWRLPHPQLETEAFVLAPLCELAAELQHPVLGKPLQELLARLDYPPEAIRRVGRIEDVMARPNAHRRRSESDP